MSHETARSGSGVVRSAARLYGRHDDQAGILIEADERSPIPDPQTPFVSSALQAPYVSGGQSLDRCKDALFFVARELAQGLRRCRRDDRVPRGQFGYQVWRSARNWLTLIASPRW